MTEVPIDEGKIRTERVSVAHWSRDRYRWVPLSSCGLSVTVGYSYGWTVESRLVLCLQESILVKSLGCLLHWLRSNRGFRLSSGSFRLWHNTKGRCGSGTFYGVPLYLVSWTSVSGFGTDRVTSRIFLKDFQGKVKLRTFNTSLCVGPVSLSFWTFLSWVVKSVFGSCRGRSRTGTRGQGGMWKTLSLGREKLPLTIGLSFTVIYILVLQGFSTHSLPLRSYPSFRLFLLHC